MVSILKAVAAAFDLYKDEDGDEIKNKVIDILMIEDTSRSVITALVGKSGINVIEEARKLKPDNWSSLSSDEKFAVLSSKLPDFGNRETLKDALELVWLGVCIGIGIEKQASDHPESNLIEKAMEAVEVGEGSCQVCGNTRTLKALGKNGAHVCALCASKDTATAQEQINLKLKEIGGPNAPIAIHTGIHQGPMDPEEMASVAKAAIDNHFKPQSDIKKYN